MNTTRNSCFAGRTLLPGRSLWLLALALSVVSTPAAQFARQIVSENGDPILYPSYLKEYNGKLSFRANNLPSGNNVELWEFDGALARLAAEINPGPTGSDPSYLAVWNGRLYFCASTNGGANKLWQYDSVNGASLAPGFASNASLPQEMFAYGGNLYFRAARFGAPSNIGIELWKFDGTNQTPLDMYPGSGSSYPQHFIEYNGLLYFSANGTPGQGSELWRYNGTGMPTEAARIYPNNGSSPENFAVFNGQLYFSATDGAHGRELWSFDGTTARLVLDINPGQYGSEVSELTVFNGALYFAADNGYNPGLGSLVPKTFALAAPPPLSQAPSLLPCQALIGKTFGVSLPTDRGRTYFLEYKESLSDSAWTTLSSVSGDGTVKTLPDSEATGSQRFYHVRIEE